MHWLCTVDPGLLQWAAGGTATALVMFGFSLGMRQGYKMGRRERLTLEQLRDRMPSPPKPAA